MKKIFIPFSILFSIYTYSQVGINTETPKATLDVTATGSLTTPDGILIPRISKLRAKNMAIPEVSTLVYINQLDDDSNSGSTIYVKNVGFYYFNGNHWIQLISGNNDTNIYNTDGTLTDDREVNLGTSSLAFKSDATTGTNHFSVDGSTLSINTVNDRVGIGTTTPESKLHVNGDLQFTGALKVGANGNPGAREQVLMSNGANNPPVWTDIVTNDGSSLSFNNGLQKNPSDENNIQLGGELIQNTEIELDIYTLTLETNFSTRDDRPIFEIKNNKYNDSEPIVHVDMYGDLNVGIGTSEPKQKLHINGNMLLGGPLYTGSGNGNAGTEGQFLRSNGTGNSPEWVDLIIDGPNTYTFNNGLQEDPNLRNNIELGGNLIQDTEIKTDDNTFSITGSTTNAFALNTSDNESILSADLANNRVGIGTQSPSNTLDINGDLRIRDIQSSTTSNNQILTIDTNGVVQKMNNDFGTYFLGGTIYTLKGSANNGSLQESIVSSNTTISLGNTQYTGGQVGGMQSIKGQGYKVSNPSNGVFDIVFNTPYTEIYGISLNILDAYINTTNPTPNPNYAGQDLNTKDNTQVSFISNTNIRVKTGDSSGNKSNRSFSFLVVGK